MSGGDKLPLASCPTSKLVVVWNCSARKEAVAWVSVGGVRWSAVVGSASNGWGTSRCGVAAADRLAWGLATRLWVGVVLPSD